MVQKLLLSSQPLVWLVAVVWGLVASSTHLLHNLLELYIIRRYLKMQSFLFYSLIDWIIICDNMILFLCIKFLVSTWIKVSVVVWWSCNSWPHGGICPTWHLLHSCSGPEQWYNSIASLLYSWDFVDLYLKFDYLICCRNEKWRLSCHSNIRPPFLFLLGQW